MLLINSIFVYHISFVWTHLAFTTVNTVPHLLSYSLFTVRISERKNGKLPHCYRIGKTQNKANIKSGSISTTFHIMTIKLSCMNSSSIYGHFFFIYFFYHIDKHDKNAKCNHVLHYFK